MVLKRPSSYSRVLASKAMGTSVEPTRPQAPTKSAKLWLLCLIPAFMLLVYVGYPTQTSSKAAFVNSGRMQLLSVDQERAAPAEISVKRVALCFFGLTRSLDHTLQSINDNVIQKIIDEGFEVDVFLHTYNDVSHLKNGRTGEDDDLDTEQWKLLKPFDHSLTSQEDFVSASRSAISKCVRHGTGWRGDNPWIQKSNTRNMLAQLNSVYEVGKLWEAHHPTRQYTAVIFARPDVKFTCPFPASMIHNIQEETVYAPNFALWKGINDRFHMLTPNAASVWKRRRFFAMHMCQHQPIHSEIFTHAFANATGLVYQPIERFGFVRVRSSGEEADLDLEFPALCAGDGAQHAGLSQGASRKSVKSAGRRVLSD